MTITLRAALLHTGLFLLTFLTVTLAGVQWLNVDPLDPVHFTLGLTYGLLMMAFLFSHEMGHYLMSRRHGVDATLPYFLPFPAFLGIQPFGTFGAVIRVRAPFRSRKALFDIGAAGPISGFIVSLVTLIIGFRTLPDYAYLLTIHPEYATMPAIPETGMRFGASALYWFLAKVVPHAGAFIPPMNEMYHYPFLCAGWFGMFVTAMNLLPVGQLDGGHVALVMFPRHHNRIAQATLLVLMVFGTLGFLPVIGLPAGLGWPGWLFWAVVLTFILSRGKFAAPELDDDDIGPGRRLVGWLCVAIFLLSFIPAGIYE
jgi:membrane-associated protease RseP (regulator of RpoE activity)